MHRDDRSGSCRSLSPPYLRSASIITAPQKSTKSSERKSLLQRGGRLLRLRFVPLCGIISTSVASHVADRASNRARCFGRKFTLWLQPLLNIRQLQLSILLLNNVDTCWHDFGFQLSCCWRSLRSEERRGGKE